MALQLKTVETSRGPRWVGDAFRLFARRPMAFSGLALVYFFAAMAVRQLPLVGAVVLALSPLLSLGFMVAAQSALLGGPVRMTQLVEPLRGDARRRRALLLLCIGYGVSLVVILLVSDSVSGHAWARLQALAPTGDAAEAQAVAAILAEPGVTAALLTGSLLASLLAMPFWHAPALVHWGGQGVTQALFSSTLAVWRAKSAFFMYMLAWTGLMLLFGVAAGLLSQLAGMPQLASLLSIPAGLVFTATFYISVLFTFNDSFGVAPDAVALTLDTGPDIPG